MSFCICVCIFIHIARREDPDWGFLNGGSSDSALFEEFRQKAAAFLLRSARWDVSRRAWPLGCEFWPCPRPHRLRRTAPGPRAGLCFAALPLSPRSRNPSVVRRLMLLYASRSPQWYLGFVGEKPLRSRITKASRSGFIDEQPFIVRIAYVCFTGKAPTIIVTSSCRCSRPS